MEKIKELGTQNISKLLWKQSFPAALGMIVSSLYNIVDAIFIERGSGPIALAGVFVTFPLFITITAFSNMLGIGSGSIISRALGSKDQEKINKVLGNYLLLIIGAGIFITIGGLVFLKPLLLAFGATVNIFDYAYSYMQVIFIGSFFYIFMTSSSALIRAEGRAKFAMTILIVSSILNIPLDYLYIFVFKMGVVGAAIATVISIFVGFLMSVWYFAFKETHLNFGTAIMKPDIKIIKEIFSVGFSAFVRQIIMSSRSVLLNRSLAFYGGDLAIAGYGIMVNVYIFLSVPIFGIMQGLQPIAGYNYGAHNYSRLKEVIKKAISWATIISVLSWVLLVFAPQPLAAIFTKDQSLLDKTILIIVITSLLQPVVGFQMVAGSMFQALGKAKKALIVPLVRELIALIPCILILPKFFGFMGILMAFPVADFLGAVVVYFFYYKELKIIDKKIESEMTVS
jgi:putative MATE family efflux protein